MLLSLCCSQLDFSCLWSIIARYCEPRQLAHFAYLQTYTHFLALSLSLCITVLPMQNFFVLDWKKKWRPWEFCCHKQNEAIFSDCLYGWVPGDWGSGIWTCSSSKCLCIFTGCCNYYKVQLTCHLSGLRGEQAVQNWSVEINISEIGQHDLVFPSILKHTGRAKIL